MNSTTFTSTSTTLNSTSSTSNTTSSTNAVTTTTTTYTPDICRNSFQVALTNGTCVSAEVGQELSAGILNNGNGSSIDLANALSLYISSTANSNLSSNPYNTVTVSRIDEVLDKLNNISIAINSQASFLIAQELSESADDIVLGAKFQRNLGGQFVRNSTEESTLNSTFSVAATIAKESILNVTSLKMFIIDKPTLYKTIGNTTNKLLASSVIVTSVRRIGSAYNPINISLYFKVLPEYQPNVSATYLCSFYDINSSSWDESGCTVPLQNIQFGRYECSCNHLTTFALTWSANSPSSSSSATADTTDVTAAFSATSETIISSTTTTNSISSTSTTTTAETSSTSTSTSTTTTTTTGTTSTFTATTTTTTETTSTSTSTTTTTGTTSTSTSTTTTT
ncbi:unnamed protein product, partial [Rotaria sp. Silwood2]